MSVFTKTVAATLVAATLAVGFSSAAEARGRFWGGFAAGAVGGLVASSIYANSYRPAYAAPAYAAPVVVYQAPACHKEWRYDAYGNPYKVRVCY